MRGEPPAEFQETGAPPQGQGDYGGDQAPPRPPPTGYCGGRDLGEGGGKEAWIYVALNPPHPEGGLP